MDQKHSKYSSDKATNAQQRGGPEAAVQEAKEQACDREASTLSTNGHARSLNIHQVNSEAQTAAQRWE